MKVRRSIDVSASATDAWELLADGFGEIGEWTSAVDGSQLVGDRVEVGAERRCHVSGLGSGDGLAVERVAAYDPDTMTYAYELVRGRPVFVKSASNVVTVTVLPDDRCRVTADGMIRLRWWLVPLTPLVRAAMGLWIRPFFGDLKYRLEHGVPHPAVAARG